MTGYQTLHAPVMEVRIFQVSIQTSWARLFKILMSGCPRFKGLKGYEVLGDSLKILFKPKYGNCQNRASIAGSFSIAAYPEKHVQPISPNLFSVLNTHQNERSQRTFQSRSVLLRVQSFLALFLLHTLVPLHSLCKKSAVLATLQLLKLHNTTSV